MELLFSSDLVFSFRSFQLFLFRGSAVAQYTGWVGVGSFSLDFVSFGNARSRVEKFSRRRLDASVAPREFFLNLLPADGRACFRLYIGFLVGPLTRPGKWDARISKVEDTVKVRRWGGETYAKTSLEVPQRLLG